MIKYPHIEQYRNVIKAVQRRYTYTGDDEQGTPQYDSTIELPTLRFIGTVKIHGTNAGINIHDGVVSCQSRSRVLNESDDNSGFKHFMRFDVAPEALEVLFRPGVYNNMTWFGEWCGKGIQKGCAIHKLSKRFIIFDKASYATDEESAVWSGHHLGRTFSIEDRELLNKNNIFFIDQFPLYVADIDMNHPEKHVEHLANVVYRVERECPVGRAFGVSGVGEGIVWSSTAVVQGKGKIGEVFRFKTKGEKHQNVRTPSTVADPVKLASIDKFADFALTTQRLEQWYNIMIDDHDSITDRHIGEFLKHVCTDIARECADDLEASNLTMKEVNKELARRIVKWFREKE